MLNSGFSEQLLTWYDNSGRHDLPWQLAKDPYHVWISETMLQQTQVKTVIPYFKRFINSFPDVNSLANASEDELMQHWSGLGYYRRAMFLHRSAKLICDEHQGQVPNTMEALIKLPGIGRSTAGAILSLGFDLAHPILDGNVKRVLCRYYGIEGWPDASKNLKRLWPLAEELMPKTRCRDYGQASMDLGALVCHKKKPDCSQCPLQNQCQTLRYKLFDVIPGKKPKTAMKYKTLYALLSHNNQQQWLMVKQPPEGLWPNLWTFPLLETLPDKVRYPYPAFTHQLTHYQLTIVPIQTKAMPTGKAERWCNLDEMHQLGLNRPSQKIREHLLLNPNQMPLEMA